MFFKLIELRSQRLNNFYQNTYNNSINQNGDLDIINNNVWHTFNSINKCSVNFILDNFLWIKNISLLINSCKSISQNNFPGHFKLTALEQTSGLIFNHNKNLQLFF